MLAFPVAPVFAASMASSTCISTGGYAAFTSGATTTDAGSLSGSAETTAAGHLARAFSHYVPVSTVAGLGSDAFTR